MSTTTHTATTGASIDVSDPRDLRNAYGTFPTGVVAVAARVDGQLVGLAASSFTSVSVDPPLVSFSVDTSSKTWPILRRAEEIGISVLGADHDLLCRQLAGPAERRFDELPLRVTPGGALLLDGVVSTFTTSVHAEVELGDHLVVALEVQAAETSPDREPLVFHRSSFGRLHREDPAPLDGRINGGPVAAEPEQPEREDGTAA